MRNNYLPLEPADYDPDWRPPDPPNLSAAREVELDAESTGVDWVRGDRAVGWAVGADGHRWYLPFGHRGPGNLDEDAVRRWGQANLAGKRIRNLRTKFDVHLAESFGWKLREWGCTFHDVSHSEALLDDHETSFNLNHLAQKRLGVGKLDVGPGASIADQPAGVIAPYAMRDVELVARLAAHYAPLLRAEGLEGVQALEDACLPAVVEIERNGMPLDLETLTAWEAQSANLLNDLHFRLYRKAGFMVNPDSPKDMQRLWESAGVPLTLLASGAPSFTGTVVQAAAARSEAITIVWHIRKLQNLRSKYLVKYLHDQHDGVLYPTLNQLPTDEGGTVSGRFSCVRPNLQQVLGKNKHHKFYYWLLAEGGPDYFIKRLFRAPEGQTWVSADMKQCEYRIFVHYTNSARLLEQYARDPLTNFHKYVEQGILIPGGADLNSTEVKVYNFLSIFGGWAGAASRNLGIPFERAQELSQLYHREFPEARELLDRCMRAADRRGWVRTLLGRRCRFPGSPGKRQRLHKALNGVVQGTAADANKRALVAVYEARRALDLTMMMTVHDSLETLQPICGKLDAYRELLNEQRLPLQVPLLWDVTTGPSWGEQG